LPPKLTEPVLELLEINLDRKFSSALKPACRNFRNLRVDLAPFPTGKALFASNLACDERRKSLKKPCRNVVERRNAGPMNCPQKIISGGQTGTDRGILDFTSRMESSSAAVVYGRSREPERNEALAQCVFGGRYKKWFPRPIPTTCPVAMEGTVGLILRKYDSYGILPRKDIAPKIATSVAIIFCHALMGESRA
jgi:hypothetical protein